MLKHKNSNTRILHKINNEYIFNKVLDLIKFTELKEINCSSKNIISIINIPNDLEILICSNNLIKKLDILKNISKKDLYGKYCNLQLLKCEFNSITNLDNLPQSLKKLYCEYNSISNLDNLPSSILILSCSDNLIRNLDNLPYGIKNLNCSHNLITNLDNLPSTIEFLDCSYNKLINLNYLPSSIKILKCHMDTINLNNLPSSIKELYDITKISKICKIIKKIR